MNVNNNSVANEKAFGVFQDVILKEISGENEQFLEETKRLEPSLELLRNVDITLFDNNIIVPIDSGYLVDDGRTWQIPLEGKAAPFPLFDLALSTTDREDEDGFTVVSGPKLHINHSGVVLGSFPHPFSSRIHIQQYGDDGQGLRCNLVLSGAGRLATLEGKLENVGPQDLEQGMEYLNNQIGFAFSCMGFFRQRTSLLRDSPAPMLTLQSMRLEYTSALQESLQHLDAAKNLDLEESVNMTESQKLRHDIASAHPGGKFHNALKQNQKLRITKKSLLAVHNHLQTVEIKHSSGTISFQLDEGTEEEDSWVCRPLHAETDTPFMIPMNDIGRVQILLAGAPLHCEEGPGYSGTQPAFDPNSGLMQITYSPTVNIVGRVHFGDYNGDQNELERRIEEAYDQFQNKLFQIVTAGPRLQDDALLFPSWFQLCVGAVVFNSKSIKHALPTSQLNTSN